MCGRRHRHRDTRSVCGKKHYWLANSTLGGELRRQIPLFVGGPRSIRRICKPMVHMRLDTVLKVILERFTTPHEPHHMNDHSCLAELVRVLYSSGLKFEGCSSATFAACESTKFSSFMIRRKEWPKKPCCLRSARQI